MPAFSAAVEIVRPGQTLRVKERPRVRILTHLHERRRNGEVGPETKFAAQNGPHCSSPVSTKAAHFAGSNRASPGVRLVPA